MLLACADRDDAPHSGMRFIRSCSEALAPAVLESLERRFGAPVLEAYGMTEAAYQDASNPLPPRPHKSATVGRSSGVELAIADDHGALLTALPKNAMGKVERDVLAKQLGPTAADGTA
jgi:acyl-CoA synthetase (AMP-forming)/AMP-acid ligase II